MKDKSYVGAWLSVEDKFRLDTLARIHYEGNMSMLCRTLIKIGLEEVEAGNKSLGVRR